MEAGRWKTSQKHLTCNPRVSGSVGDFISDPSKCCCHQRLFGNVVRVTGERCYLVHFDDGQEKECSFNISKVESFSSSLPLDIPLPAHDVVWDISAVEKASGDPDVLDNEEVEDMPAIRPEKEDVRLPMRRRIYHKQILLKKLQRLCRIVMISMIQMSKCLDEYLGENQPWSKTNIQ
jgi:hypothetical protein